jgi:hypothetical protein
MVGKLQAICRCGQYATARHYTLCTKITFTSPPAATAPASSSITANHPVLPEQGCLSLL